MATTDEGNHVGPLTPTLAGATSLLLAATALGAGLAFFLGWRYEKAYLEEWGLSFSAFSYSPYELMVVSSTTLIWAIVPTGAFIIAELTRPMFGLDSIFRPPHPAVMRKASRGVLILALLPVVPIVALVLVGDVRLLLTLIWMALVALGGLAWQRFRHGLEAARWIMWATAVAASLLLLVVAPGLLGRSDAKDDRGHPERLPRVLVTLHHSLGLADEAAREGRVQTGPWRLIRANNGSLWLSDGINRSEVVQIASSDVAYLTYLRD